MGCACGHAKIRHSGHEKACEVGYNTKTCGCTGFQPAAPSLAETPGGES